MKSGFCTLNTSSMTVRHQSPQCNLFQLRDQKRRRDVTCRSGGPARLRVFCGAAFRCVTVYRSKSRATPFAASLMPERKVTERIRAQEYAESPGTSDIGPDGGCEPDMAEISQTRTRLRGPWAPCMQRTACPPSSATSGAMRHRAPARRSAGDSRGSHPVHRLSLPAQHGRLSASGIHVAKG